MKSEMLAMGLVGICFVLFFILIFLLEYNENQRKKVEGEHSRLVRFEGMERANNDQREALPIRAVQRSEGLEEW